MTGGKRGTFGAAGIFLEILFGGACGGIILRTGGLGGPHLTGGLRGPPPLARGGAGNFLAAVVPPAVPGRGGGGGGGGGGIAQYSQLWGIAIYSCQYS